jgi:hypothetical protein
MGKLQRRPRSLSKIKKTEITRTTKGILATGLSVRGVEVDPISGKFRVLVGKPDEGNDLDKWMAERKSASST